MPYFSCCVPGCTSSKRKVSQIDKYPWMEGVKFHSLPDRRRNRREYLLWLQMIRRETSWTPNKYTRICSRHFAVGGTVPILFPYNNYKSVRNSRPTINSTVWDTQTSAVAHGTSTDVSIPDCGDRLGEAYSIPYVCGEVQLSNDSNKRTAGVPLINSDVYCVPPPDHPYCSVKEPATTTTTETGCQTDITFKEMEELDIYLRDKTALLRDVFVKKVTKSDQTVKKYTGLPSIAILMGLFNILCGQCTSSKYWSGANSAAAKSYQDGTKHKPGP